MKKDFITDVFSKHIPQFISVIFHPVLMPTIGVLILFNSGIPVSFITSSAKNIIITVIALCTFCLPVALLPIFYFQKMETLYNGEKKTRLIPLLFTLISYYFSFYILHKMQAPSLVQLFSLATAIAVFITLIITLFWKISAHMIGVGGIVGLIVLITIAYSVNLNFYLISALIISGVIGSSRLSLNTHTPNQVYVGFLTGLLVILATFLLI